MTGAWYSVKEKLPPEDEPVQCRDKRNRYFIGMYCGRVHASCWLRRDYDQPGLWRVVHGVTHWCRKKNR